MPKLINTIFGDDKHHGTLRQLKLRGIEREQLLFIRHDGDRC